MPTMANDKAPPKVPSFFQEMNELLDQLGHKIGNLCDQYERSKDPEKLKILKEGGLKISARLAVLRAGLDIDLGVTQENEATDID